MAASKMQQQQRRQAKDLKTSPSARSTASSPSLPASSRKKKAPRRSAMEEVYASPWSVNLADQLDRAMSISNPNAPSRSSTTTSMRIYGPRSF
ncbi:hypothetical protein HU200_060790 [Digitaria exilis]|uniref:Uncharacterized protein n=1 Tax=Digitaria exilis TaxID=1010633 RepID=A0A835E1Y4_9POAL|nr:hypothetical protein HU200_060790 [Digitaria exilis]